VPNPLKQNTGSDPLRLSNPNHTTFDFVITDDGSNLTFSIAEVGDPANSIFLSTTDSEVYADNLITFRNRPYYQSTDMVSFIDSIRVESLTVVPEPGSTALLLCAAFALLGFTWRRRKTA